MAATVARVRSNQAFLLTPVTSGAGGVRLQLTAPGRLPAGAAEKQRRQAAWTVGVPAALVLPSNI